MKTSTLGALVTHKVCMKSQGEQAFMANPSSDLLKKAKSATYNFISKGMTLISEQIIRYNLVWGSLRVIYKNA
jgi:hypothetical protein